MELHKTCNFSEAPRGHFEIQSLKKYTSASAIDDEEKIANHRQTEIFFIHSMCITEALIKPHSTLADLFDD